MFKCSERNYNKFHVLLGMRKESGVIGKYLYGKSLLLP
jgi:hypothetical protein